MNNYRRLPLCFLATLVGCFLLTFPKYGHGFSLVMMGARRGRGDLKRSLDGDSSNVMATNPANTPKSARSLNKGKGQEITGVTLPADGNIKGWEFGNNFRLVCANVNNRFFALDAKCPRCAFDLWKGDLIVNDPGFDDLPRIACPTCSTTYAMTTGKKGPPLKRTGLAGFVGNLAKTATIDASSKNAKAYIITRDEDGRVYCRER